MPTWAGSTGPVMEMWGRVIGQAGHGMYQRVQHAAGSCRGMAATAAALCAVGCGSPARLPPPRTDITYAGR